MALIFATPNARGTFARTALALLALAAIATVAFSAPAQARYAAIVIDAESRQVLFARHADVRRHPASLTKIMTLYLIFEALHDGHLKLDDDIVFSRRAVRVAPSRIGVPAGQSIRVENAIMALITKSANDVARAVAEHLAGSEAAFAQQMTAKAHSLGMNKTTFRNASGLYHRRQRSTARDMAVLGLAIQQDFPEFYPYFSATEFRYRKRVYRNHNNLLISYSGTDGIKTGFIGAAGFNLVASVRRGRAHLIGVVFGGNSAKSRDRHMRRILDGGFKTVLAGRPSGRFDGVPLPLVKPNWQDVRARLVPLPPLRPDLRDAEAPVRPGA